MKFRWLLEPPQPLLAERLAAALKISPLLAQCLLNRGLSEPGSTADFLQPRLKDLADPFLLPNMPVAVERLFQALERKEALVIFGDYDVDGVSSTAILLEVFSALGWRADAYLPHRLDEGYGLSPDGLENCLKKFPVSLVLAVDCGSGSSQPAAWLRERGADLIVLDHHQVCSPPPAALALVNPQLTECNEREPGAGRRFTELCSAGLAFKLAHALVKRGRERGLKVALDYDVRTLLDLVALGTVADLVPLTGENRILVRAGLERLNTTERCGLVALKRVAQSPVPLSAYEVGFQLGPRLNAAGRLESAEDSLRLLRTRDIREATALAEKLDRRNRERQQIERGIVDQVVESLQASFNPNEHFAIVAGEASWHIGVVGIVAARIVQQFYRPTIIVGSEGGEWRGSGRSIAGFDLAAALRQCNDLLTRHGGHAMAAGLSLPPANLEAFRSRLNEVARKALGTGDLQAPLRLDAEVQLVEISLGSLAEFGRLQPMGQGNPTLHFCARGVAHDRPLQRMGAEKDHVKMWITDGSITHEAVWWRAGLESLPVGRFDLAFAPEINQYNGRKSIQLKVLDWRPSDPTN